MSGGSKDSTVTQKTEPPSWAIPYFQDAVGRAQEISSQPYTPYTGQLVASQTPDQYASQDMIRSMAYGPSAVQNGQQFAADLMGGEGQYQGGYNPYMGASNTYIGGIAGGGGGGGGGNTKVGTNRFLGENPYVDQMIAASSRDVTDNFSNATMPSMLAQFQQGGAFGGTAMQNQMTSANNSLAQGLGDLSNQYRFQDYQTQQALEEAGLDRSVQAQLADKARQSQAQEAAAARNMQAQIAQAQLYDQGLSRNSNLAENALGRDQQAWGQFQGNQLAAMGMVPELNQAQYYGAGLLGQQGLQQQGLGQTYLDANYNQFLDARNWDVNRFQPMLQGLAAIQGGSVTSPNPNQSNPGAGALGGALSGAAAGSTFGPWGTAIGAGVGGLAGYLGS